MTRPLVIVSGRHRPHEILLLAVSLVTGLAYTIGAPPPASVSSLLPGWALHVWSAGLLLSGVIGLTSVASRAYWALKIEASAMLIGAAALVWYSAAIATFGWRGLFAGAITGAWAAANLVRALQIRRDLRLIR